MSPMQLELSISFFDIYVMPSWFLFLRARLRIHEDGGGGERIGFGLGEALRMREGDETGKRKGREKQRVGLHLDEGGHALEFDESSFDFVPTILSPLIGRFPNSLAGL